MQVVKTLLANHGTRLHMPENRDQKVEWHLLHGVVEKESRLISHAVGALGG